MAKPHFIIKNNMNKSTTTKVYMKDIITDDILEDVCFRITGQKEYDVDFVDNSYEDDCLSKSYNKGRLATLIYNNKNAFISFSEEKVEGRDSAVQSVPTAFNIYYQSEAKNKELYYYFLGCGEKFEAPYLMSFYRQMKTIGFNFLNPEVLSEKILPYTSIEDLIFSRRVSSGKNSSNNSSYVTKEKAKEIEIYGKTYGANKYDASMLGFTSSVLAQRAKQHITLYEIIDKNLMHMPRASVETLELMGNTEIISTNLEFEKNQFENNNSLRSPRYKSNLLARVGIKHCPLCHCEIPEIIEGAHIWPVSIIKKQPIPFNEQFAHAISGDNGIWLCENHHKLFDENIIKFDNKGKLKINTSVADEKAFIKKITEESCLPDYYHSDNFFKYLRLRNKAI